MTIKTQVLIIGAGPVGLIAALSLVQSGISCILVDRRLERLDAPKAHAVNPRTLEICERLGVSAKLIKNSGAPPEEAGQVHFMDVLNGACFGSLPYERQDDAARAFTPWPLVNIAQPQFESIVSQELDRNPSVSLLRGFTASDIQQQEDNVTVNLTGRGLQEELLVQADYIIAADGAGSRTREHLGINMTGPEALQHYMMIHFEADLTSLTSRYPGLLYFCLSQEHSGVFIGYDRARTWVFMQSYDPATQSLDDFDSEVCCEFIEAAAGQKIESLIVKNISPWTMSAQVADTYRSGRVFLAGDAAHRFPPTGGLGLNTGAGDVQNLCWKLAMVLNGSAHSRLLDSYELERRPVAQLNCQQSLTNSAKLLHLFGALYGQDATGSSERYQSICNAAQDYPEVAQAVEMQRPHFDSFNLQLGYRYGFEPDPESIDISNYIASFEVGDCLPHVALTDESWLLGKLPNNAFSLVTGPEAAPWKDVDVRICSEGSEFISASPGFCEQAGLASNGALLIRPDGHICGRWEQVPADPAGAVNACLNLNLGN